VGRRAAVLHGPHEVRETALSRHCRHSCRHVADRDRFLDEIGIRHEVFHDRFDVTPVTTIGGRIRRRRLKPRWERAMLEVLLRRDLSNALFHIDIAPWTSPRLLRHLAQEARAVVTLHTALIRPATWRRRIWRRNFSAVAALPRFQTIAANEDVRRSLAPYIPTETLARVPLAYSPVDVDEVTSITSQPPDRAARLARVGIRPDQFVVATAAQFIERKGCWTLLDAARRLRRDHPDIRFVWLSTLPLSEPDRRRVAEYGLGDVFRHVTAAEFGPLRADYLGLLRAADVFVLPSFEEGLPLAMLEAMAIGLPVISTPVNAIPEAIVSGRDGLLVAPGSAEALAAAIARLKSSPDLRASLASAGRHRAVTEFDSRTMADVTLGVYAASFARPC
jgi:glycosyltransferase involved in cell wall biosynthesis